MSQTELAAAVAVAGVSLGRPNGCTKRLVQRWESGEHAVCRPHYLRALHMVTGLPAEELGFVGAEEAIVEASAVLAAATGAGRRVADDAPEWLRCALTARGPVGAEEVGLVEAAVASCFEGAQSRAAGELAPVVTWQVAEVAGLLAGARSPGLRRRLAMAGGWSAALAGWLVWSADGDGVRARRYWDAAVAASGHGGDGSLLACVFLFASYEAQWRGDAVGALALALRAGEQAGGARRERAWCLVRAAELAALLGRRESALGLLDRGLAVIREVSVEPGRCSGPGAEGWAASYDRFCAGAVAAEVHALLGDASAARSAMRWAMRNSDGAPVAHRAVALAGLAVAAARIGDAKLAENVGAQAAELAARLDVGLARRKLGVLTAVVGPPGGARS